MGVATITHPKAGTLQLRTDPNSILWNYHVNTKVEETYGGRVVQLLSASIDDLVVTADAGRGGWQYLYSVATFFRNMLFDQREGGEAGVFSYPPRGWELGVYAKSFPFKDDALAVAREFTMNFKVQEDISGVITTDSLNAEIAKLKEGIGWKHNEYNTPAGDTSMPNDPDKPDAATQAAQQAAAAAAGPQYQGPLATQ